ncbi:hypothetical protein TD95_003844 [Thielaviopsis punctulata]|uniref:RING-type domain-containing protein n=1 Tax=Thielaviopsis punctulata TaxID=72032 RepID=A0A0F4Z935_9PEZI|nr:hypothetical protein TD95_003844 [Thielaviopsis punctulata]
MDLQDLDIATIRAIAAIQLADLAEIESRFKGKSPMGSAPDDAKVAVETLRQDLEREEQILSDHLMCLSINEALRQDCAVIATERRQERLAARDRRYAEKLQQCQEDAVPSDISDEESIKDPLEPLLHSTATPPTVAGPSSDAPQSESDVENSCVSCVTDYPKSHLLESTCGHFYCRNCICTLFTLSFQDESLFPPQCCQQNIPFDSTRNKMINDDMRLTETMNASTESGTLKAALTVVNSVMTDCRCISTLVPSAI